MQEEIFFAITNISANKKRIHDCRGVLIKPQPYQNP